jgi:hypothetical protein
VLAADHGTGAGRALLEAVTDAEESVALWVADPNPPAQAFIASTGSLPMGRPRSRTGCGRYVWSATVTRVPGKGAEIVPAQTLDELREMERALKYTRSLVSSSR